MRTPSRAARTVRLLVSTLGTIMVACGIAVGASTILWPHAVQEAYGKAQIAVGGWRIELAHEVPIATLGTVGDRQQLSRCDGTFTRMQSYERDGVPPVWAAHNNCGGDVVLPLQVGDSIDLVTEGRTVRYDVVDIRDTPKVWATTDALIGLRGDVALQTCFYGGTDVPMRFVGLAPARLPAPEL